MQNFGRDVKEGEEEHHDLDQVKFDFPRLSFLIVGQFVILMKVGVEQLHSFGRKNDQLLVMMGVIFPSSHFFPPFQHVVYQVSKGLVESKAASC